MIKKSFTIIDDVKLQVYEKSIRVTSSPGVIWLKVDTDSIPDEAWEYLVIAFRSMIKLGSKRKGLKVREAYRSLIETIGE